MLTGTIPSSGDDIDRLRLRYEQLCDLVTRTAEADPDAAERVLVELQTVSEQLLALEEAAPVEPDAPAPEAETVRGDRDATGPAAVPERPPAAAQDETAPSPPDAPARVVAFRAAPESPTQATNASDAVAGPEAPPRAQPAQQESLPAIPRGAAAGPAADHPPAGGGATVFSSAIRQWLEQRRGAAPAPPAQAPRSASSPPPARGSAAAARSPAPAEVSGQNAPAPGEDRGPELARLGAAVEQQAVQIERILALCESHQIALERLEARIEARLSDTSPAAMAEPGDVASELPALRGAVEDQRQRITSLAKTIHNLAQWLASQRSTPGR